MDFPSDVKNPVGQSRIRAPPDWEVVHISDDSDERPSPPRALVRAKRKKSPPHHDIPLVRGMFLVSCQ